MSPPASRSARGRSRGAWTSRSRRPPSATSWPTSRRSGLLYAPHTSAGRVPTDAGPAALRRRPAGGRQRHRGGAARDRGPVRRARPQHRGRAVGRVERALGACRAMPASSPPRPTSGPFRHIEFVPLSPGRALVIVVGDNGMVENRVIDVPLGMSVVDTDRGRQLPDRAAGRAQLRRGPRPASWTRSSSTAASSTR